MADIDLDPEKYPYLAGLRDHDQAIAELSQLVADIRRETLAKAHAKFAELFQRNTSWTQDVEEFDSWLTKEREPDGL